MSLSTKPIVMKLVSTESLVMEELKRIKIVLKQTNHYGVIDKDNLMSIEYQLNPNGSEKKWTQMIDSFSKVNPFTNSREPHTVTLSSLLPGTFAVWRENSDVDFDAWLKSLFYIGERQYIFDKLQQEQTKIEQRKKLEEEEQIKMLKLKKEIMMQAKTEVDEVIDDWFPGLFKICKNCPSLQAAYAEKIISDTEILDLMVQRFTLAAKRPFKPIEEIKADILQTFSCRITALERRFGVS